jgi:hypothetical protein
MSTDATRVFDHVLIIMFENQYRSYVMRNTYFRNLAAQGIDLTNAFGVMHPSQTNYIASIAGELCNVTDDEQPSALPQRTIVDLIEEAPGHLGWKAYMDSYIPQNTPWTPDLAPTDEYPYVIKHNPFSSFENIMRNEDRWNRIVSESQLWRDLLHEELPHYAWFTPNMWNDGHYLDGEQTGPTERAPVLVDQAARWLERFFDDLRFPGPDSFLPDRTLVVVTFDESDFEATFDAGKKYTYDGPNQIYTVLLGDMIQPGVQEEGYNHYSLLKTVEHNFGLGSLHKNDRDANWLQFLWGRAFRWAAPTHTPVCAPDGLTTAEYADTLYVMYQSAGGPLMFRTFDGDAWSEEESVGHSASGTLAAATCGGTLVLVCQASDGTLSSINYCLDTGWSTTARPITNDAVTDVALTAYNSGEKLMLAWRSADNTIRSLVHANGQWASTPTAVGHESDGPLTLATLGPSLFLIHKTVGDDSLTVVSYNTAPFNVVTLAKSKYGGPYDNTTQDAWSPSGFLVARFSSAPSTVTPGEEEPITQPCTAGGPLTAATLDGVIHLAHAGVSSRQVVTETFSISGVMTPERPISYNASDALTTSNGYGTVAEAGWSAQRAVHGVFQRNSGVMTMARLGTRVVLLYQPDGDGHVAICTGSYV